MITLGPLWKYPHPQVASFLSRLVAQIHDELLFEVEDSQIPEFAGVSRKHGVSVTHEEICHLFEASPLCPSS